MATDVTTRRGFGLVVLVVALGVVTMAGLAVGAKSLPWSVVWHQLFHADGSDASVVVRRLRVPRTLLGIAVGAALGLAGALMQALTRNPLADPGILGVNAGAAAGVVIGIAYLGFDGLSGYVWCAFAGAALTAVVVYSIGATGRSGATPARLALAGTAIAASLTAFTMGVALVKPNVFDTWRAWSVGSLTGRDLSVFAEVAPFLVVGAVIALALGGSLNALALGDDAGRALGAHPGRTRAASAVAVTLLCGAATAAVGPIAFIGLAVPHVVRLIVGPDQRWVLPYSMLVGAILLVTADVIGRIVVRPGELEASIVAAALGAPVFIALVRRRKLPRL